jgi:hypothetical protein
MVATMSTAALLASQGTTRKSTAPDAPASTSPAQTLSADQQAVLVVVRQIAHAHFKRDVATFQHLTADEFVHLDPDGALTTKQDWIRILEDEPQRLVTPPEPLDAPPTLAPGMLVRVVGSTAIVVTTPPPAIKEQPGRVVTVLVKRGTGWQQLLVNRQIVERAPARE